MSQVWAEVKNTDNCMWKLSGRTWESEPSLEEIQEVVEGYFEMMPRLALLSGVHAMYVNEDAYSIPDMQDRDNQLATMQCNSMISRPVLGNVIIRVDEEFLTSNYWLGGGV